MSGGAFELLDWMVGRGNKVFLDLKLHDIPATVRGAALAVAHLHPAYLTVHASGGAEMVAAAVEALPGTRITAVTVLTSLDADSLAAIGLAGPPEAARRIQQLPPGPADQALRRSHGKVQPLPRHAGLAKETLRIRGASETTTAESLGQLRRAVAQARVQRGRFEVWVTHMFVLADLVGTNTSSGEGLVLKADAAGTVKVLARLPIA